MPLKLYMRPLAAVPGGSRPISRPPGIDRHERPFANRASVRPRRRARRSPAWRRPPVGSEPADDGAPRQTTVGTSPISPDIQAAFCQDQVAFMHGAEPQFATAHDPVVAEDGSTTIEVTIAGDNEGIRTFQCRLDASNRFAGVTTTSIQGAL